MTDSYYQMSDMCATCGERYGRHSGMSCRAKAGQFVLAAGPTSAPGSYHYPAALDDYFTRAAEQANRLVFPSGAAILTSGDKIVGRVEASPATYDVSVGNRLPTTDELHDALRVVLDSLYAAPKTQRAPLPNSDEWRGIGHKAHDTFGADFIVTKGEVPTAPPHTSPATDSAYPAIAGLLRG